MNKPDLIALWEAYTRAVERFQVAPTFRNEGRLIAVYAEWCRATCAPGEADGLITDFCKNVAASTPRKRAA